MATKNIYLIAGGTAALIIIILLAMNKKAFKAITKPFTFRGEDAFGSGTFGASRSGGTRTHKGIDVVATPGQDIFAPISGKVTRFAVPYADDSRYKGIEIVNDSYKVKMFYIAPVVAIGTEVKAGQKIATAQNIAAKYGTSMINHVHFEVYDSKGVLLNPTSMFTV